jgi:anti-anti-sigma factor
MEQRKPKGGGEAVTDRVSSVVTITEYQDEHGWHVALRGRVDVRTAADLRLALHRLIAAGSTPLLLDLAEVHVGDATGFGLIVECQRRARRAGRQVHVVAADARTQRRDRPWVMRTYAGHSTAAASNALYRTNLAKGQTGLSVAFDLPTQTGYDPDSPLSRGEVGKVGVPIPHIGEMRRAVRGHPAGRR